jgi:hypothetical protein
LGRRERERGNTAEWRRGRGTAAAARLRRTRRERDRREMNE